MFIQALLVVLRNYKFSLRNAENDRSLVHNVVKGRVNNTLCKCNNVWDGIRTARFEADKCIR